jgi:hypothetical protein
VLIGDHNIQLNFFTEQRVAAAPVTLAQLPPLAAGFTGRETELAQVAALLDPAAAVQPGQTLDALLRSLGVPGEHVPEGQSSGLRCTAPCWPGPGAHRVIVTSRHILAGLGARQLDVTVLGHASAVQLLDRVLQAARPGDGRVSGDQAAAIRLAEACGLPLALQVAGALLVADPVLSVAELAGDLTDEVGRLGALRYDDGSGSRPVGGGGVRLSYRQLDQDAGLLFQLLPTDLGPDLSTGAAAALAGWPKSATCRGARRRRGSPACCQPHYDRAPDLSGAGTSQRRQSSLSYP